MKPLQENVMDHPLTTCAIAMPKHSAPCKSQPPLSDSSATARVGWDEAPKPALAAEVV
jgi:hypothetical protein